MFWPEKGIASSSFAVLSPVERMPDVLAGIRSFLKSWGPAFILKVLGSGTETRCRTGLYSHRESFLLVLPQSHWGQQLLTGLFQRPLRSLDVAEEEEAERPSSSECTCLCVCVQKCDTECQKTVLFKRSPSILLKIKKESGLQQPMSQK